MSEFDLLAIPISLVLGLGVTQILSGVTGAIRARDEAPLHWLPLAWAFFLFLFQVHYFFVIWDINLDLAEAGRTWTWTSFGPSFFHAVLLFLGAGLVLPSTQDRGGLLADFDRHGRLALVPLALAFIIAIPLNVYQHGATWTHTSNILNVFLGLLIAAVLFSKRRWLQGGATLVFGVTQIYAMLTVWSQPGTA